MMHFVVNCLNYGQVQSVFFPCCIIQFLFVPVVFAIFSIFHILGGHLGDVMNSHGYLR
jgi:hypothetical protein